MAMSGCHKNGVQEDNSGASIILDSPQSLQQVCFLYVVTNLELFPPEVLALLPLKFRRELLLLLPPADIFQLEQTSVVDGIDMENEVWKVVCERYDFEMARKAHTDTDDNSDQKRSRHSHRLKRFSLPKIFKLRKKPIDTWKGTWLSFLFFLLFHMYPSKLHSHCNRNFFLFLQLLFCNQFFTLKQISKCKGLPLQVFGKYIVVARHVTHYTQCNCGNFELVKWIKYVLTTCCLEPPQEVSIEERHFSLHLYKAIDKSLLQQLFRRVESINLQFYCIGSVDLTSRNSVQSANLSSNTGTIQMVVWLFDIISTYSPTTLHSVRLSEYVDQNYILGCVMRPIRDTHKFDGLLQKLFVLPYSPQITGFLYSLQNIHIVNSDSWHIKISLLTFSSLFVVLHSPVLKTLRVSGITVVINDNESEREAYKQTIEGSLPRSLLPSCSSLELGHISNLPLSIFIWLLNLFLHSFSIGSHTLSVSHCQFVDAVSLLKHNHNIMDCNFETSLHKSLHLSHLQKLTPCFLKEMSNLSSITLENLKVEEFMDCWTNEVGLVDFFQMFFFQCQIKSFVYCITITSWRTKQLSPIEENEIKSLFTVMKERPETTNFTLQCRVLSDQMQLLLDCLVEGWEKNSGGCKLDNLIIVIVMTTITSSTEKDSLTKSHLHSMAHAHPVTMTTNLLDIKTQ